MNKMMNNVAQRVTNLKLGRLLLAGIIWCVWAPCWLLGRLARGAMIVATWIVAAVQDGFASGFKQKGQ